jgi:predicted RNase H-like HicB family nuclease
MGTMNTFAAVVQKDEDMYVATCPEVGTASQGKTIEEAVANLKEATELYLEEFPAGEKPRPRPILATFEVAETAQA